MRKQTVVVTGASGGIGRAVGLGYLAEGANVVLSDLEVPGESVASAVYSQDRALAVACDISEPAQVRALMQKAEERFGGVDVLVANAGVGFPDRVLDIEQERWDKVLSVNLTGTFLCVQAALRQMVARGSGSVVIVSSVAGRKMSVLNGVHYTTSKYGLVGMTRHLANELTGTGVRVNCVCPGPIGGTALLDDETSPQDRQRMSEKIPLGRLGEPDEVAEVIRFVAGPGGRFMHGAIVDVNGGLY